MGLEDLQSIKRTYSENITAVTTLTAKIITDEIEETLSKSSPFTKLLLKIGENAPKKPLLHTYQQ